MDASLNLEGGIHFVLTWILLLLQESIYSSIASAKDSKKYTLFRSMKHLIFKSAKKCFHYADIIAIAFSGHGLNDTA